MGGASFGNDDPTKRPAPRSTPRDLEVLDQFIREKEKAWVDERVPALGGLTPRQAAGDPTRREDLDRLLRQLDADAPALAGSGGAGFDASRIRQLLDLQECQDR